MKRIIYDYTRTAFAFVGLFQLLVAFSPYPEGLLRWFLGASGLWLLYRGIRIWRTPFITLTDSTMEIATPSGIETFECSSILHIESQMSKGRLMVHLRDSSSKSFAVPVLIRIKVIEQALPEFTRSAG
jgi:hypothetical protein